MVRPCILKFRKPEHICHEQLLIFKHAGNPEEITSVTHPPKQKMAVIAEAMHQKAIVPYLAVTLAEDTQLPWSDLNTV